MLRLCSRLLRGGALLGHCTSRSHPGPALCRLFSVREPRHCQRDYSLPNASWSRNTRDLYQKYEALCRGGAWKRIPSYNSTVHHMADSPPEGRGVTRLFTRNLDQDGAGFEYSMFYNTKEKRMICTFQPGPYLEGPPGYTHGGCIATILDSTLGAVAVYIFGLVMTANLTVNYRKSLHQVEPVGCGALLRLSLCPGQWGMRCGAPGDQSPPPARILQMFSLLMSGSPGHRDGALYTE
ncbi:acyl-coenzyme A thioesterase THEM4 isoform X2 [Engystomops pustulosus]